MTEIVHRALPQPERSRLRKMSAKTTINNQIQMKNKKNQSMDHSTCPVPNSAATTMAYTSTVGGRLLLRRTITPAQGTAPCNCAVRCLESRQSTQTNPLRQQPTRARGSTD